MKKTNIAIALVSPLLLISLVLAYPFYLLYKLVDENSEGAEFV